MNYSVWNHADRLYHYYQTPDRSAATSAPTPAHLRPAKLGATPEQAGWPLPSNAKPVGKGKYPKGHIASLGSFGLSTTNIVIYGVLGYFAYRWWKKRS